MTLDSSLTAPDMCTRRERSGGKARDRLVTSSSGALKDDAVTPSRAAANVPQSVSTHVICCERSSASPVAIMNVTAAGPLHFVTGSVAKFEEARTVLPHLVHLNADLPEIQSDSATEVIRGKLDAARREFGEVGEFMVEDTSLHMVALGGLPGPFVKWFLRSMGAEGLFRLANTMRVYEAEAVCIVGHARNGADAAFFEARLAGTIVSPRGESGFGWDSIFVPQDEHRSFAEMEWNQKRQISPRTIALRLLRKKVCGALL